MGPPPLAGAPQGLVEMDEHRHRAPAGQPEWCETYSMDFTAVDGGLAGFATITVVPASDTSWYWAGVVGPGRPLVAVVDNAVPPPSGGPLEIRTSGLWADHVVETPWDHLSLGLEAFALAVDDPDEMAGADPRGHRVPLGFELDFDTAARPVTAAAGPEVTGYEIPCTVHGEILIGAEAVDFAGVGFRYHRWGAGAWSGAWARATTSRPDGTASAVWHRGDAPGPEGETLARAPLRVEPPHQTPGVLDRRLCRGPGGGLGWHDRYRPG